MGAKMKSRAPGRLVEWILYERENGREIPVRKIGAQRYVYRMENQQA